MGKPGENGVGRAASSSEQLRPLGSGSTEMAADPKPGQCLEAGV